jgi:hypothetical protein
LPRLVGTSRRRVVPTEWGDDGGPGYGPDDGSCVTPLLATHPFHWLRVGPATSHQTGLHQS